MHCTLCPTTSKKIRTEKHMYILQRTVGTTYLTLNNGKYLFEIYYMISDTSKLDLQVHTSSR